MYLVALIAVVTVAVLCWKAFGPQRSNQSPRSPRRRQIIGPDDDPDFLWRISRQQHRDGDGGADR